MHTANAIRTQRTLLSIRFIFIYVCVLFPILDLTKCTTPVMPSACVTDDLPCICISREYVEQLILDRLVGRSNKEIQRVNWQLNGWMIWMFLAARRITCNSHICAYLRMFRTDPPEFHWNQNKMEPLTKSYK